MKHKCTVLVEGSNLWMKLDRVARLGYFTTRYVEAENEIEASKITSDLIRVELFSQEVILNDVNDPPLMEISEIKQVDSFVDNKAPGKGFTFFPDGQTMN